MKSHAEYYITNRDEFVGEDGHRVLLRYLHGLPRLDNAVALDVGSCIGNYIPNIEAICPDARILCFEPNPVNIEVLEPKIKNSMRLFKCCISNETGTASFQNWKGKRENTAGNGNGGLRSGGAHVCTVDVRRLEDVLDEEGLHGSVIQFIKIDTEGNDGNVIKSLGKYLASTRYIIFECSDCLDDCRGPGIANPMKDIVDFLDTNGFDVYRIGTRKMLQVNGEYWDPVYESVKFWSNCFALKKGDTLIHSILDPECNYRRQFNGDD